MIQAYCGEFPFYPYYGTTQEARCFLEIWRDAEQAVVIAAELPENPGNSITNAYESLAEQVTRHFGLGRATLWFEYYPACIHPLHHASYDLVMFGELWEAEGSTPETKDRVGTHFELPSWRAVTPEFVRLSVVGTTNLPFRPACETQPYSHGNRVSRWHEPRCEQQRRTQAYV